MKVFFDASVLFSAIYSSKGASFQLVSLVKKNKIIGITTQTVINELKNNLPKLKDETSKNIDQFIVENNFIVRQTIIISEIKPYLSIVEANDAHVVAGAILTSCHYLVTLDKKHLNNQKIKEKIKKVTILSPKELLMTILSLALRHALN